MRIPNSKCVYVMHNTDFDLVKIGISNKPKKRASQIRAATGCEIIMLEHTYPLSNAEDIERWLHIEFEEKRRRGEWFDIDGLYVCEFIKTLPLVHDEFTEMYLRGDSITEISRHLGVDEKDIEVAIRECSMETTWKDRHMKRAYVDLTKMERVGNGKFVDSKGIEFKVQYTVEGLMLSYDDEIQQKEGEIIADIGVWKMVTDPHCILNKYIKLTEEKKIQLYENVQKEWTEAGGGKIPWKEFLDYIDRDIRP